eukprot:1190559-Prorocentrum_minimum.AAC.1
MGFVFTVPPPSEDGFATGSKFARVVLRSPLRDDLLRARKPSLLHHQACNVKHNRTYGRTATM